MSGEILEILVDFHKRDREAHFPVGEDVFVIVAADLERVTVPVHIKMDDLVARIDHLAVFWLMP